MFPAQNGKLAHAETDGLFDAHAGVGERAFCAGIVAGGPMVDHGQIAALGQPDLAQLVAALIAVVVRSVSALPVRRVAAFLQRRAPTAWSEARGALSLYPHRPGPVKSNRIDFLVQSLRLASEIPVAGTEHDFDASQA